MAVLAFSSCTKTADLSDLNKEKLSTADPLVHCMYVVRWIPAEKHGEVWSFPIPIYCMKLAPCLDHPFGPVS